MPALMERLRGVVIEQRDALAVCQAHDGPETLHYVDPPYVHDTRSNKRRSTGTGRASRPGSRASERGATVFGTRRAIGRRAVALPRYCGDEYKVALEYRASAVSIPSYPATSLSSRFTSSRRSRSSACLIWRNLTASLRATSSSGSTQETLAFVLWQVSFL